MGTTPTPAPSGSTAAVPPAGEGLSESSRIIDTFIAPSKTFTDINRKANWWAPWILMAVLSIVFAWVLDSKIGFQRVVDNQLKGSPKQMEQLEKAPPDQREQQLKYRVIGTRYFVYATPILLLLFAVTTAAVLMGSFNFGAGAQVSFSKSMAVVMYSYLVGTVTTILAIVSIVAGTDPEGFRIENPVATNLGFFVSSADHPALYVFLSSFDVVTIWMLVLIALGFTYVTKAKKGTAFAIVFGWWIVWRLALVGLAAM
jgi:Yip1 domain